MLLTQQSIAQTYFVDQDNDAFDLTFESPVDITIEDNSTAEIPIGFNFNFFGNTYTTFHLSENGFIQFGSLPENGCCEGQFLPSTTNPDNLIAAAWMDNNPGNCCSNGQYYSVFQYETIGLAPDRICIITLDLVEGCSAYYFGQIKLFETSDIIEIHTDSWADGSSPCNEVTQGIENVNGTEAYFLAGRNANTGWNVPCCSDVVRFTPSYSLPQNDAGISYIFNEPQCPGSHDIQVLVTNYGVIPLDSVVLDWTWDGAPQSSFPVEFNPPILFGESQLVVLGQQTFVTGESYDVIAWTLLPNGQPDDQPSNDPFSSVIYTGVQDTFTIGGTSPDFATFMEAIDFLDSIGVCDTTWVMVRPGTYNEQITIPWIAGAAGSQVIFRAENGDSSSVIIEFEPTLDDKYVIRLNNAAGITLERLTINALGTEAGRVIQLSIHSFDNLIQHCAINGINTSSTDRDFACICSQAYNPDNIIQHNTIRHGSYGVYHEIFDDGIIIGLQGDVQKMSRGSNNGPFTTGIVVRQNDIENFSYAGVATIETEGILVEDNQISSDKDQTHGIQLTDEKGAFHLAGNRISLTSGFRGIDLSTVMPGGSERPALYNNFIYAHHDTEETKGVFANSLSKTDIFHNTINVTGSNAQNNAFEIQYMFQDSLFNNLFTCFGGGKVFNIDEVLQSGMDHNGYYHEGSALGLFNVGSLVIDDLEEWRDVSGFDQFARFYPPFFVSDTNLHLGNSYFNKGGSPLWAAPEDIDGEVRDTFFPDIGADEFDPELLDASIVSLLSPTVVCDTFQAIKVALINLGTDTLVGAELNWTFNGIPQTPIDFSGMLLPEGDTVHVVLQSQMMFDNQPDSIVVWAQDLNEDDDAFPANDTLSVVYQLPLTDTFTIGGTDPDFISFSDALEALEDFSVCGPVTFLVRNGVYNEQLVFNNVSGTSPENTITFISEGLDSSLVTIEYDATANANYVLKFDQASHYRFEHIGFRTINSTHANLIYLSSGSTRLAFDHCYFKGRNPTLPTGNSYLIYSDDASEGHISLTNSYFLNGTRAIYLIGSFVDPGLHDSIYIKGNQFIDQRNGGILVQYAKDVEIAENTITSNTSFSYTGLSLGPGYGNNTIHHNQVNLSASGDGISVSGVNAESELPGVCDVSNNMSSVVSGSAFSLSGNRRLRFLFNSGYSAGTSTSSHHAIKLFGGDSIVLQNNIAVANSGRAYSETFYIPEVISDYNNYFTSGPELAYRANTPYADMALWQTGTTLDSNSYSVDPEFVSNSNLHILNTTLNGKAIPIAEVNLDFDHQERDTLTPDIGADEIGTEPGDAGILTVLPKMPFARGVQDVKAVLRNFGSDTIYTALISWELNGVAQTDYFYSGELSSLQDDTLVIGSVDFELANGYQFKAWTSLPNGTQDASAVNDTVNLTAVYPAVSGVVTVGPGGEVTTIGDAIDAMAFGGIQDSVRFELETGTYHESVSLDASSFYGCGSTVLFTSATGNAEDVIWDNMGTGTHTILFNGADGITFSNLTIKTVINATQAIRFQNGSTCNTIQHCMLEGVTTTSTSSTYAVVLGVSTSSANYNHDNTLEHNTFLKGSTGLYWDGYTGTTGLSIGLNTFQNAYSSGFVLYRLKAPTVFGNTVSTNSAVSSFTGIYAEACSENSALTGNKILMHGKRGTGIYFYLSNGTAALQAVLANNFIILGQGASSYGLYCNNSNYARVLHNTIRISGGNNTGTNILRNLGGNYTFLNNILDNQAGGKTMQFNGSGTPLTTNYNTHFTEGTNLINYLGTNYTSLAAWQATGRDVNSQNVEPLYDEVDPLGYKVLNAEMNGMGTPAAELPLDIEGQSRDTLTPDIGCDEFNLFTDDVGLLSISYPSMPFPAGLNTVYIKFINNGVDTLTAMEVNWEVDSVTQPTYFWTGLLPSAGTYDSLDIGTYDFSPGTYHHIKVWVSQPNGVPDQLAANDTLSVDSLYPGLQGVFTIGGVSPDFESISQAVAEINKGGACGPVTFNLRTGTYLDTILLHEFPGSSCDRPVIFQSESGYPEDVLITNLGLDAHTIRLNGADGIIFQNLSLESVNTAFRHVVNYYNGSHCNQFLNNVITGYQSTSQANSSAVIYSPAGLDSQNVFSGNLIQYGSYSLYLYGSSSGVANTTIIGNTLESPYASGVYAREEYSLSFDQNTVIGTNHQLEGIVLYLCHRLRSVSGNTFHIPLGQYGLYIEECDNLVDAPGVISNNMINIGGSSTARGIYALGSSYQHLLHNNIHVYSTHTGASITMPLYLNGCPSMKVFNNICSNGGLGYGIYAINNTGFQADYNNYHILGANVGYWNGVPTATLSDWRISSGQDQNGLDLNPQFMTDEDLHVSNILLNGAGIYQSQVSTDIDGEIRNNPPDIGADEFDPALANDAGVFMAIGPTAPFAPGTQPIVVAIKNYGAEPLTTVKIRWVVNGIEQPIFTWNGSLPSAQCDTVIIGQYVFPEHTPHQFLYWTEMPNEIQDSAAVNDTLQLFNVYPAMEGLYTVGGVLPDFNLLSQLEGALMYGGILGDVTFSMRNGTYNSQLLIRNFPRTTSAHKVTFTSEQGDSSLVQITRTFNASDANNYTIRLSGAHHIKFEHLTLASTKGRVLDLQEGSSRIEISHCRFSGVQTSQNTSKYQLIYSATTSEDSVTIEDNRFEYGDQGIYLIGSSGDLEQSIIIRNNNFYNQYQRSIYVRYTSNLLIEVNTILNDFKGQDGMAIYNTTGLTLIRDNDIRLLYGGSFGMYLYACTGTALNPIQVFNNYILSRQSPNTNRGIGQEYCDYLHHSFNTVRLVDVGPNSVAFWDHNSYDNVVLQNCIFSNEGGGKAIATDWSPYYTTSTFNYCNLYTTGPVLAYCFIDYDDLAALQAGTNHNLQGWSVESLFDDDEPKPYQAVLNNAAQPVSGISTDIDGETRNPVAPDVGALEFSIPAHDIGIKKLIAPQTYCGFSTEEEVSVRIQNYGANQETGFDIAYKLNNQAWVTENVGALSIAPGATLDYTFSLPADLSQPGLYSFTMGTSLGGDLRPDNDTLWFAEVTHIPVLTDSATNLIPLDGATDLDKTVNLSWAPAENATKYDVYIWDTDVPEPVNPQIANIAQINKNYSNLAYGQHYYWKVVAKNSCDQMVSSAIQEFGVRNLPDLLVDTIVAPSTSFTGQQIEISWNVRNAGPGGTQDALWSDAVYLSTDATLNLSLDIYLGAVQNLTALDSGDIYAHEATFTVPNYAVGNYYVFVHSDRFGNVIETNNNNNWTRSEVVCMIELSPLPDLDVIEVSTPDLAFSGQVLNLLYTVKNSGTAPTGNRTWHDRVILTQDPSNAVGYVLGTFSHTANLEEDSTYIKNLQLTIPQSLFGIFYVYVISDFYNVIYEFAAEANNTLRGDTLEILLTPPPDLFISDLVIADTIYSGYYNTLTWTVDNLGAGPTLGARWKDQWYISPAPVYNPNFNIPFANKYQTQNVESQDQYFLTGYSSPVLLPAGYYYLYGFTDQLKEEYEYNMEGNNIYTHPDLVYLANADLRPDNAEYPDTIEGNTSFLLLWDQINSGGGKYTNKKVSTKLYASNDEDFDIHTAVLLRSEIIPAQHMLGYDTLSKSAFVQFPSQLSNDVFLHIWVNDNGAVYESSGDSNNIYTIPVPIFVIPPPTPDLEVLYFSQPDTVVAGVTWTLQYATSNEGNTESVIFWEDDVYISFDPVWNPLHSQKLADIVQNVSLEAGDTIHNSVLITLPNTFNENVYYIYVISDEKEQVYEGAGESNNIKRSDPIYVKGQPIVDLAIDTLVLENASYVSGQLYGLTWTTEVLTNADPIVLNWKDHVYLSLDMELDTTEDIRVGLYSPTTVNQIFNEVSPLMQEEDIFIPLNVSGSYYLIIESDFTYLHHDTVRENNVALLLDSQGEPQLLTIQLAPLPDLFISTFTTPSNVITGQSFEAEMCIKNIGTGNAAGQWQNQIYLSSDQQINAGDIQLATFNMAPPNQGIVLFPDSVACYNVQLVVPSNYVGNYYLIARTDPANRVYELSGESNNTTIREIESAAPPPADLIVEAVTLPSEGIAGDVIQIHWTTKNTGTYPAYGGYREIIYLSADTLWSIDDPVFGIKDTTRYIPPLTSVQTSVSGAIEDVAEGLYYAVVQTDVRQQIPESDNDNNTGVSFDGIQVEVKTLYIDSLTTDTLLDQQPLYYKINVLPGMDGESMVISLQGDSVTGYNELYCKFGQVPSRGDFDFGPQQAAGHFQHVIIPTLEVGTYYIAAYGSRLYGLPQPVELLARIVPYQIHSITPSQGVKDTKVTVEIRGIKLDQSEFFRLRNNSPWIERKADEVFVFNENLVYATFDLTEMPIDTYTIEGVRPDSLLAWVENGFRVVENGIRELQIDAIGPGAIWRWSRTPTKIMVTFQNTGDIDIEGAIVVVESPMGNLIAPTLELLRAGQGTPACEVLLQEPNGPPGILRPGASGTIEVFAWTLPGPSFVVGLKD